MNTFSKTAAILAAGTLGATGALAQTATTPQTTPPATTAPATPDAGATTATPTSFTDADVDQFATAVVSVQKIQGDASVAATDKQAKMAAAVQAAGLTPTKFNAMAQASQSDPALMKRIQTAAAAKASPGAAAGSAGGSN